MAGKWGRFTKDQVLKAYNEELELANERILKLRSRLFNINLGVVQPPTPTSLKQALDITRELKKISSDNLVISNIGDLIEIKNPSKYLRIQEVLIKKIKGRSFRKEFKIFTAEEASKILAKQQEVNKKRRENKLPPVRGLRFEKDKDFSYIYEDVSSRGSDFYIEIEKDRVVKGVITSLNSAYQILVDDNETGGDSFKYIKELIDKINSDSQAYSKIQSVVKNMSTDQLVYMFSSDKIVFDATPELFKLLEAFNISSQDYYDSINNLDEINF